MAHIPSGPIMNPLREEAGFTLHELVLVMMMVAALLIVAIHTTGLGSETTAISRKKTAQDAEAVVAAARTYCRQGAGVPTSVSVLTGAGFLPASWAPQPGLTYDLSGSDATRVVLRVTMPPGSAASPGDLKWVPAASWSVDGSTLTVVQSCVNPETGELAYGEAYFQ